MSRSLRTQPFSAQHILVTGATGYVGSLIVASLLQHTPAQIVCLTRPMREGAGLLAGLWEECQAQGAELSWEALNARIEHAVLPHDGSTLAECHGRFKGVEAIIHCAGSVDYYDAAALESVNVNFTQDLLALAQRLPLKRFVFISTAFCSGYQHFPTPEALLDEPPQDPTPYTRTKRRAEHLVAASGVPYVILRPSIVIGSSTTGRYSGKRYGLYQHWMGLERLTCDRYHPEFHTVAQTLPVNFLHQDAWCAAWAAAYAWLPDGAICHIVARPEHCPSMRDIWDMWFAVTRPRTVYYYPSLDAVPLRSLHPRQRAYLTFAQINLEIAAHPWRFETTWLDQLRAYAPGFVDTDVASVRRCQDRFIATSDLVTRYLTHCLPTPTPTTRLVDGVTGPAPPAPAALASMS